MVKLTLDSYLQKIGITRYEVSKRSGIIYPTIDAYYKNKVVRYDSYILDKICTALDCDISDIVSFEKDK